jgi:hypothetical protein
MIELIFEFILVGLVGGLLGLFYRNCLKPQGMIFNFIYYGWLKPWAECTEDIIEAGFTPKAWDKVKAWVAKPLGYCIYCSTFWITFILCIIAGSYKEGWNSYSEMLIAYITALSVQHLVVAMSCRWLINKHPDLDTTV